MTRPFITIMCINFMLFLSFNMLNPSLPIYFQQIGISESMSGVCISIFTIGSLFARPLAGNVLDHLGRRNVFFISMAILTVLLFGYSFATTVLFIMVLRLIHGFDWGFASTSTNTIATDIIPRESIGQGMGIFGLSMSLALAIAPSLAISLIDHFSFAVMIYVSTVFLLIALLLGFCFPFKKEKPAAPAPVEKQQNGKKVVIERTAVLPSITMGFATLTMAAITTFVPLYALSLDIKNIGLFFTVYAIGLIIVRFFIGSLMDRHGLLATAVPSFVSMLIAILLLAFLKDSTMLLLSGFFYGAGFGGAQTTMQSLAVMNAPAERFGAANATFYIGFDLGIGCGALFAGFLSDAFGFAKMYLCLCIFMILAIAILLKYCPRKQKNV